MAYLSGSVVINSNSLIKCIPIQKGYKIFGHFSYLVLLWLLFFAIPVGVPVVGLPVGSLLSQRSLLLLKQLLIRKSSLLLFVAVPVEVPVVGVPVGVPVGSLLSLRSLLLLA